MQPQPELSSSTEQATVPLPPARLVASVLEAQDSVSSEQEMVQEGAQGYWR